MADVEVSSIIEWLGEVFTVVKLVEE